MPGEGSQPLMNALASLRRHETPEQELLAIVNRMLDAIQSGDKDTYRSLCSPDLSCFETDVAPYRIDGIDFHLGLIEEMRAKKVFSNLVRFDVLTPRVQVYDDTAIVCYTRLMTYRTESAPVFKSFNETRVFVRFEDGWKMVHFHRSEGA
jgi:ketosteroid isomerase-like protein